MINEDEQNKLSKTGLMKFIRDKYPQWENIDVKDLKNITTGWETQIFSFVLAYTDKKGALIEKPMILRIYPGKHSKNSTENEFQTLTIIKQAGYSVPEVYGMSTDYNKYINQPFLLMQKIEGKTLGSMIRENPDYLKEYLIVFSQLFVKLHRIKWREWIKDLSEYEDVSKIFNNFLDWIRKDIGQYDKTEFQPILDWLIANVPKSSLDSQNLAFVHNDFHPENILIDYKGYVFVIDWHKLTIMDYRYDLAWTLMLIETFESTELRNAVLQMYELYSERIVKDIKYFEVAVSLRRLLDLTISFSGNINELGMRNDALDMMKKQSNHFREVHQIITSNTKITIPEMDDLLQKLSE